LSGLAVVAFKHVGIDRKCHAWLGVAGSLLNSIRRRRDINKCSIGTGNRNAREAEQDDAYFVGGFMEYHSKTPSFYKSRRDRDWNIR